MFNISSYSIAYFFTKSYISARNAINLFSLIIPFFCQKTKKNFVSINNKNVYINFWNLFSHAMCLLLML